jgi:co-chaperonin GroES (HSP10)
MEAVAKKMKKVFKTLRGRRIMLTKPVAPKSLVELDEATKATLEREMMAKWTNLEVYAIGEDVECVKAGDRVYVSTYALSQAEIVEIEGSIKLMIAESDIAIIW